MVFTVVTLLRWIRICSLDQRTQDAGVPGVLTDAMGWASAQVTARWTGEERSMSDLILPINPGLFTRVGDKRKARRQMIWILGDVAMPEFEKMGWP